MEGARTAGSTLTEEDHEGPPGQQPGNSRSQTGKEHTDQNTASSTEAYLGKQGQVTLHHKMNCAGGHRRDTSEIILGRERRSVFSGLLSFRDPKGSTPGNLVVCLIVQTQASLTSAMFWGNHPRISPR